MILGNIARACIICNAGCPAVPILPDLIGLFQHDPPGLIIQGLLEVLTLLVIVTRDSANKMLLLLWPYMKSFIEKVREDIKNGTSNAADDMKNQLSGASPLPARSRRGC